MGWDIPWFTITDELRRRFRCRRMARHQRFHPRRRSASSAPISSTTAATSRWAGPGTTSISPRSAARRSGRTCPKAILRRRPTNGGTGTTAMSPTPARQEMGRGVGCRRSCVPEPRRRVMALPMPKRAASFGAAEWLSLSAAPVFAIMALLTAIAGDSHAVAFARRAGHLRRSPAWRRCTCSWPPFISRHGSSGRLRDRRPEPPPGRPTSAMGGKPALDRLIG